MQLKNDYIKFKIFDYQDTDKTFKSPHAIGMGTNWKILNDQNEEVGELKVIDAYMGFKYRFINTPFKPLKREDLECLIPVPKDNLGYLLSDHLIIDLLKLCETHGPILIDEHLKVITILWYITPSIREKYLERLRQKNIELSNNIKNRAMKARIEDF